ncbi:COP9 signalosome complex subunit 2, partial [Coemansia sp. RSA 1694]
MSDDDFMYDEEEEYEFEYEEADDGETGEEVGIENRYYNAKGLREDFDAAIREFQTVIDDSPELTEWGFKATKQMLKLCLRERRFDDVFAYYEKMLQYVRGSILTRNYAEKSINNMLERVSAVADPEFTQRFHQLTLDVLKETKNDRLWLRTSLRLAKILLDQREYPALDALLSELKRECEDESGAVILERGTQLLEIHA